MIVTGREAGGHISQHDISIFSLVQQVTSVVNIPVIAAGGIIDGKGAKGMFAMGAQGVYMGTRFIATHENRASATAKQAILMANSEDYLELEGASPILAFIASDGAHYLNGQMIGICGGMQILA
ncbi:nitronate monooxygenase [Paenibacillus enshidis]|uniref:Probable nitronate monooxygenase n=1 Tax=Paenibacillus enshidis TaxID=1458439 RepID=A0ABV5AZQ4_9BACL